MDASASSQQTMLRCGNDVSEGDAEVEVEAEKRSEAERANIKTSLALSSAFPQTKIVSGRAEKTKAEMKHIVFFLPCTLLLLKLFGFYIIFYSCPTGHGTYLSIT